ncbi:MAG: RNA polymerase sigma factor [Oscillospiraceae bacterium]|nr:RNA polymerase sigma factor [Oscillospiraceae bacterium]
MNRDILTESVIAYRDTVLRVALGYMKNIHDAEDIAQNVFMKLYNCEKSFPSKEAEKAWLIRVTINEAKNVLGSAWFRNRGNMNERDEGLIAPGYMNPDDLNVYDYVKTLNPKYRTVIYLYYYEGYSTKEISSILKISQSTVTTQLKRARKQLKDTIEKEEETNEIQGFI